jgi:putative ABC transport system permease protein
MSVAEIKVVTKLVGSHLRQHPGRVVLTLCSIMAAACVVVWVVSGYDSLSEKFREFSESYMGRYELVALARPAPVREAESFGLRTARLNREFIDELAQDPAVQAVDKVFEARVRFQKVGDSSKDDAEESDTGKGFPGLNPLAANGQSSGPIIMGGVSQLGLQSRTPMLVGTDSPEPPHALVEGKWIDPRHPDLLEAAISKESAEQLKVKVGDELRVSGLLGRGGGETVKVIGILEQPKRLPPPKFMVGLPPSREAALRNGPASAAVYVPTALAEKLSGAPAQTTYAGIVLKNGSNSADFAARWEAKSAAANPPVEIRTLDNVGQEIDNSTTFETVRSQAYSATGISLLAALFIIFTTLSMGVNERIRQFAILRAVSLTKWQVAAMIALESTVLGLLGWAGGLLAGWGLLQVMAKLKPEALVEGASLGLWCIVFSGLCALGGSLAAAVLPAWRATTVSPLDAMAPQQRIYSRRFPWITSVLGVILVLVNPLLVFWIPMADKSRYLASAAVGCTSMAIGFMLLAPLAIVITEKLLGPPLAIALRLNPRLLATQLSTNLWRTIGITIALTLGLGLYMAMQTWGYSMLGPFSPGDWAPDAVVIAPGGVPDSAIAAIRNVPGIVSTKCAPLAVAQTKFAEDLTGFKERASATRQDSCVMIGVDPEIAFGGDKPLFNFEFASGSRKEALEKLKQGRYCLVPDHFQRESGLGVGDKFKVIPPGRPDETVEYEIAGVVSMPGWHWLTKTGFRRGRAAGLMFSPIEDVRKDFETGPTTLFWTDLELGVSVDNVKGEIQKIAAAQKPEPSPSASRPRRFEGPGAAGFGGAGFGSARGGVNIITANSVREQIRGRADGIIWALSQLPLVTLLVTAIGIVNTVMSSIRARRWDMGVLRALGLTRFALFRLVVAESLLVGVVACVLSFGFGTMAGYCGTGVTRYVNIRGGMITPLIIPWPQLMLGAGIALGLCFIAALLPAIKTGRAEPLKLLQAGRAAM